MESGTGQCTARTDGIGFRLVDDYRRSRKKRLCCSGGAVKCSSGRVLHHLCWADDLYIMAGTMENLTRILKDMTNAIERLGVIWKEKPCPRQNCDHKQQGPTLGVASGGRLRGTGLVGGCAELL